MGNSLSQQEGAWQKIENDEQGEQRNVTAEAFPHPTKKMSSLFQAATSLSEHIPPRIPEPNTEVNMAAQPTNSSREAALPGRKTTCRAFNHGTCKNQSCGKSHEDKYSFQFNSTSPILCKAFFLYHGSCEIDCPYSHDFGAFGTASTNKERLFEILKELRRIISIPDATNDRLRELLSRKPGSHITPKEEMMDVISRKDKFAIIFSPMGPTLCREFLLSPQGCQKMSCGYSHDLTPLNLGERSKKDILNLYEEMKSYILVSYRKVFNDLDGVTLKSPALESPARWHDLNFQEILQALGTDYSTKQPLQSINIQKENIDATKTAKLIGKQIPTNPFPSPPPSDNSRNKKDIREIARSLSNNLRIPGLSGTDIVQLLGNHLKRREEPIIPKLANELADAMGVQGFTGADVQYLINQEHIKALMKEKSKGAMDAKFLEEKFKPVKKETPVMDAKAKSNPFKYAGQGSKGWTKPPQKGKWQEESMIANLAKEGKTLGDLSHFVKVSEEGSEPIDDLAEKFDQVQLDGDTKNQGIESMGTAPNQGQFGNFDKAPRKPKIPKGHYANGEVVASSAPEIQADNRGYVLLEKHGWSKGEALGAGGADDRARNLVPIEQKVKIGKEGLR